MNVITFVHMNVKTNDKRVLKGYKIKEKPYLKAMRRAKKEKTFLANVIEEFVEMYGNGYSINYRFDFGVIGKLDEKTAKQKEA